MKFYNFSVVDVDFISRDSESLRSLITLINAVVIAMAVVAPCFFNITRPLVNDESLGTPQTMACVRGSVGAHEFT